MKTLSTKKFIPLILVFSLFLAGCKKPVDCVLAARQPIGNWEFITAYPSPVITPPSGGNDGVANVVCYYKRSCIYWFNCCDKYFPVAGTEYGTSDPGPGSTQPVKTLGMPLPLQGALGQAADLLGVSLDIATWFVSQGAANALCAGTTGINHKADYVESTPQCDGKNIILPWHTWRAEQALEKLPDEVERIN